MADAPPAGHIGYGRHWEQEKKQPIGTPGINRFPVISGGMAQPLARKHPMPTIHPQWAHCGMLGRPPTWPQCPQTKQHYAIANSNSALLPTNPACALRSCAPVGESPILFSAGDGRKPLSLGIPPQKRPPSALGCLSHPTRGGSVPRMCQHATSVFPTQLTTYLRVTRH